MYCPPSLLTAGRYDMLCIEGIAMMLNIFLGRKPIPKFRLAPPAGAELETMTITRDVRVPGV